MRRTWLLAAVLAWGATAPIAQELEVPRAQVLVIEFDRLVSGSRAGQRILADLEGQRQALVSENLRIEEELTEEERQLTEQRSTLPADEFRGLAEAFDAKVTAIRSAQDEKARSLTQEVETRQQAFLQTVRPILQTLLIEADAEVLIERGSVLLVQDSALITDLAIARIDAELRPDNP